MQLTELLTYLTIQLMTPTANTGLHVRYEKAGQILDILPIPWNADAVILEANVRLPKNVSREKSDFTLQLSSGEPAVLPELVVQSQQRQPLRVLFRIPPPAKTCSATVRWREHVLGEIDLPTISLNEFVAGLSLEMPTLHAGLGEQTVACRAIAHGQTKSLFASAILRGAGPLAPVLGLGTFVDVLDEWDASVGEVGIALTGEQLRARQALITARLPKLRRAGEYRLEWHFGPRCLQVQRFRTLSKKAFERSLRISATRFLLFKEHGATQAVRSLPMRDGKLMLDGITQVVPCFYICSNEAGAVGLAPFTIRALFGETITTIAIKEDFLVTDGPTPIFLGAVKAEELTGIKHFTLACRDTVLGNLPTLPTPSTDFTAEGGFAPVDDYLWSPAAEEQLQDRLGKLLDGD